MRSRTGGRWAVIPVIFQARIARPLESRFQVGGEIADGDLYVNDILCCETWHSSGADVVHAQRELAQRLLKRAGYRCEFVGPFRAVVHDDDWIDTLHTQLL